jgi:hypothetical protein
MNDPNWTLVAVASWAVILIAATVLSSTQTI